MTSKNCLLLCGLSLSLLSRVSAQDVSQENPENGIQQLTRLFTLVQKYRELHNGSYPTNDQELIPTILGSPHDYGFKNMKEASEALSSPDDRFDDRVSRFNAAKTNLAHTLLPIRVSAARPDGTMLGGPKIQGTYDVLASLPTYRHANPGSVVDNRPANPTGFYLILKDEGVIVKVPYDEALFRLSAANGGVGKKLVFKEQAGAPWDCLTYAEHANLDPPGNWPIIGTRLSQKSQLPMADNGLDALVVLSRQLSFPNRYGIEREDIWKRVDPEKVEFTLSDIQTVSASLNLHLEVKKISLDEVQKLNSPVIVSTADDKRNVVLAQIDDEQAVIMDRGSIYIVDRELLAKRYGGEALIFTRPAEGGARVAFDDPIRILPLKSVNDEIEQSVKFTNTGTKPLTLQLVACNSEFGIV